MCILLSGLYIGADHERVGGGGGGGGGGVGGGWAGGGGGWGRGAGDLSKEGKNVCLRLL